MFDCFRGPTVRIEKHANPGGPLTRSYQYIRTSSTKSQIPSSATPTPASVLVHRPPPEVKPVEDNFHPPEGDNDYPQPFRRHNVAGQFHPLPIIHRHPPPQQNNQPQFGAIDTALPNRHLARSNGDNATVIIDDHPQRAVVRVPKHDSRGRRVVRVHRSHPHRGSLSRNTSRARSGSGKYYSYYEGSGGSRFSRDWDDSDSWTRGSWGTVKSGDWSDGGDSWDGNHEVIRTRRIGGGGGDGRRRYYLT